LRHAQSGRGVNEHFAMHVAGGDRRDTGNEPAFGAMRAPRSRQLSGHGTKLDPFQIRSGRRQMRLDAISLVRTKTIDHLK
jgi:hypothetical protein